MSSIGESDLDSSLEENENLSNGGTTGSSRVSETKNYAEMKRMKELQEAGPRLSVREQLAANKRENELKNKSKHNTTPRNSIKPNSTQRNSIIPHAAPKNNNKTTQKDPHQTQQEKTNSAQENKTSEPESDQSSEKSERQTFQSKRRTQQPPTKRQSQPAPRVSLRPRMSFAKQDNSKGIPVKDVKTKSGAEKQSRVLKDDTFGDMERKLVKQFRENFKTESYEDDDLVEFYRKLADIYYQSGMDTENIYNILRASGLLNICLALVRSSGDEEADTEISQYLIDMESAALKRVIKLKPNEAAMFHNVHSHKFCMEELKLMRDVYEADFSLLISCIKELPDMQAILETETLTNKQLVAEDKIIAIASLMASESFERKKRIISTIFNDSVAVLGHLPCNYALSCHSPGQSTVGSFPFGAMNLFLLIEKESAAIRTYFRNLLSLVAMKMLDLGETALLDLNIRSLHWMKAELEMSSGFALLAFMDDVDKKNLPKIFIERLRSPVDLLCSATSNKGSEREDVYEVSDGPKFVCGDPRLFKELASVRQTVVQREQADVDYKEKLLNDLHSLVLALDPFDNVTLTTEYEDMIQRDVLDLPEQLLSVLFGLEKYLVSDNPKTRLEEMMLINYVPLNAVLTIATQICDGVIETRFADDTDDMESPRSHKRHQGRQKPFSDKWWPEIDLENANQSPRNSQSKDQTTWNTPRFSDEGKQLKELKLKKRESMQGSDYYRGYMVKNTGQAVGYIHPAKRASQYNLAVSKDDDDDDLGESSLGFSSKSNGKSKNSPRISTELHPVSQVRRAPIPPPVDPSVVKPKNASDRVRVKDKPNRKRATSPTPYKKKPPVVEAFQRLVTSVPVHNGKPKDVLKGETVHNLTLLHCLTTVIKQSRRKPLINTDHKAPQLDKKVLDTVYLKVLQIILPLIEHLRPLVKTAKTATALKKTLYSMDLSPIDNELAVALACFYNMKYQRACKAVYSYLENRSDITFVGEPFPSDLTEVCQELIEEKEITMERYESIHTLLGHCHMRRESYDDAVAYWTVLLSITSDPEKLAQAHTNLASCYIQLETWPEAIDTISCAMEKYKTLPRSHLKAKKMLIKLNEMKTEVEGVQGMKSDLSLKKRNS